MLARFQALHDILAEYQQEGARVLVDHFKVLLILGQQPAVQQNIEQLRRVCPHDDQEGPVLREAVFPVCGGEDLKIHLSHPILDSLQEAAPAVLFL